ncbi:phosphatase family protein [Talaromyces proteolyticus]|uniref:Phosphatase family protein n=1 Tax=Talaromyces proteolyticus TaxID=1131652 RepID=A0AAD4KY24_9EURO|nr:phosphatase family protein [Talaromyces proteolyticus]KAH8702406.1 phosphatase family protein [Talaromyces proteolyticus]
MAPAKEDQSNNQSLSDSDIHHQDEQFPDDPPPSNPSDLRTLKEAVRARRAEYVRPRTIRIKVGTWNVAAISGTERDIGKWFVEGKEIIRHSVVERDAPEEHLQEESQTGHRKPESTRGNPEGYSASDVGIYVLGLQEIVDVSSPSVLSPFVDPGPSTRWKEAAQKALPAGYELVAESQLVGILLLIYAAPNVAPTISSVSSSTVGTGLMGYVGNKGATVTRLVLGETTSMVFVNCHLAAGADKGSLERRNWDASQIITRTKFSSVDPDNEVSADVDDSIGSEDFGFWFGDLNYRLDDIPGDDVRRLLMLHTQNDYDARHNSKTQASSKSSQDLSISPSTPTLKEGQLSEPTAMVDTMDPSVDPSSLLTTLNSLLPHDQLRTQQLKGKVFHEGWREGEIRFLPTYKYDVGSISMFDTSEKQRGPSWCDRILYRSKSDRINYDRQVREAEEARKRDEEMKARGIDKAAEDENVLFDYNPETDGAHEDEYREDDRASQFSSTRSDGTDGHEDPITLTHYTSHQGILSSDHKPLDAAFVLTYDAVIPELKRKVCQDVVRELDKAENEARPDLTVIVDNHHEELDEAHRDIAKDQNAIYFGGVPFGVPVSRTVTVANTGAVPATFYFTSRLVADPLQTRDNPPPWLEVRVDWPKDEKKKDEKEEHQDKYTLAPGDSATVDVTARVKQIDYVRALNDGTAKIEDILVFRVSGGRDQFIPVYGKWLPTCFGRSLEELTHIPEAGVRSLGTASQSEAGKSAKAVRLSAPRELFRLTEAISRLTERAVAEWGMMKGDSDGEKPPWLSEPHGLGWPFDGESWTFEDAEKRAPLLFSVREALDTGSSLGSIFPPEVPSLPRLEIFAETLVSFLQSLKDGIIKADTWKHMEQQLVARERSKNPWHSPEELQVWVLDTLAPAPVHSVSFTFLTFMLTQIINEVAPASNPAVLPATLDPPAPPSQTDPNIPPEQSAPRVSSEVRSRRSTVTLTSSDSKDKKAHLFENPMEKRRDAVERTLSSLFANLMISSSVHAPLKEKERLAWEERKRIVVQAFLQPTITPNLEAGIAAEPADEQRQSTVQE